MGQRWYDSSTGRFISQDPIGFNGGLNLYEYADGNPVSRIDPSGLLGTPYPTAPAVQVGTSITSRIIAAISQSSRLTAGVTAAGVGVTALAIYAAAQTGRTLDPEDARAQNWANQFEKADAQSKKDCRYPRTLYHYTSKGGLNGILESQQILPSSGPKHARFGPGQYFSDIPPEAIGTVYTTYEIIRSFYGNPVYPKSKISNYLEVNVDGLPISNPRPGTFLNPTDQPLDVSTRIVRSGDTF